MQRKAMGHFTGKAGGKGKADGPKGKGCKGYKGSFGKSNELSKGKGKAKGKQSSKAWNGNISEQGWRNQDKQWKQLRASAWGEAPSYENGKGGGQNYWEEWPVAQSSKGGKGWNGFFLGGPQMKGQGKGGGKSEDPAAEEDLSSDKETLYTLEGMPWTCTECGAHNKAATSNVCYSCKKLRLRRVQASKVACIEVGTGPNTVAPAPGPKTVAPENFECKELLWHTKKAYQALGENSEEDGQDEEAMEEEPEEWYQSEELDAETKKKIEEWEAAVKVMEDAKVNTKELMDKIAGAKGLKKKTKKGKASEADLQEAIVHLKKAAQEKMRNFTNQIEHQAVMKGRTEKEMKEKLKNLEEEKNTQLANITAFFDDQKEAAGLDFKDAMNACDTKIEIHKKQILSLKGELEEKKNQIEELLGFFPKEQSQKDPNIKNGGSNQGGQATSIWEDDDDLQDVELTEADWEGESPETIAKIKEENAALIKNREEHKKQKAIIDLAESQAAAKIAEAQAAVLAVEEEEKKKLKKMKAENGVVFNTVAAELKKNAAVVHARRSNLKFKGEKGASSAKK